MYSPEGLKVLKVGNQDISRSVNINGSGGLCRKPRVKCADCDSKVLLATGRYLGEGFDEARLDTLFLTLPVSWKGTVVQYAGRLHRNHYLKKEVLIYDYVDSNEIMLARMYERRRKSYKSIGYMIT